MQCFWQVFGCKSSEGTLIQKSTSMEEERHYGLRGSMAVEKNKNVSVQVSDKTIREDKGLV